MGRLAIPTSVLNAPAAVYLMFENRDEFSVAVLVTLCAGSAYLGGRPLDFADLQDRIRDGRLAPAPKIGGALLGADTEVAIERIDGALSAEELIREMTDVLSRATGQPTTSDLCRDAIRAWVRLPTADTLEAMRKAYEAVPTHLRRFVLGDQDLADVPLRMIIYGEGEMETWSHRVAAKGKGIELPSINAEAWLRERFLK